MAFEEPDQSGGNGLRVFPKDVVGHLLLLWAVDYIAHSPSKYSRPDKPSDVIVVDLVDLDTVFSGECLVAQRCWWRPSKLIQALRRKIGAVNPMLVKIAMEPSSMGMNDAYVLVAMNHDLEAVARAEAWLTSHPDFTPSESFPQAAAPGGQASPAFQPALPTPAAPVVARQPTLLERMAAQATSGAARIGQGGQLPPAPPQSDTPPF